MHDVGAGREDASRATRGRINPTVSEALFRIEEEAPDGETFLRIRADAGMRPRSGEGVSKGLGNELYSVILRLEESGEPVGMGRIVGDGGTIFVICDMAVTEEFQGKGGGTMIMNALMKYILSEAPPKAYINLMADVDGFYERWGFEPSLPSSRGMVLRFDDHQA